MVHPRKDLQRHEVLERLEPVEGEVEHVINRVADKGMVKRLRHEAENGYRFMRQFGKGFQVWGPGKRSKNVWGRKAQ
jgi:hypothetical protein